MARTPPAVNEMVTHLLQQLTQHRARYSPGSAPPLFVGVQGPQGSGKTFLTAHLRHQLTSAPHSLSVVVLSIDDLYLPYAQLAALAHANPENPLLNGRGQPGTHDINLGTRLFHEIDNINTSNTEVKLPVFDKSLHGGKGDRANTTVNIRGPVDIFILEGWCVGFYPRPSQEIERRWQSGVDGLGYNFLAERGFKKQNVLDVNGKLGPYVFWWNYIKVFIQIKPDDIHPYIYIYKWRLEQERNMKAKNGGRGMTDEQVAQFVDRYIPGYVFFGDGVTRGYMHDSGIEAPPWSGNGLQIQIDENRDILGVYTF